MQTAGARALREDDQEDMSREAVLLQWERKIEAEERRPSRSARGEEDGAESAAGGTVAELRPSEDATHEAPRRFERRTVTITGQPTPARRRAQSVMNSPMAQPERLGLWAFLLGLFLMVVAAGTAHA